MRADAILGAVQNVTKTWAKQRKAEERKASRMANRRQAMTRAGRTTIVDAAAMVMEEAYLKASAGGKYPAHARQIYYPARGPIEEMAGRKLKSDYFNGTIVPDYIANHPDKTRDWDVVFDARGHLEEPHTGHIVDLGTLGVREYLTDEGEPIFTAQPDFQNLRVRTKGPACRYGALLFIEKEGFMPLFKAVKLAERYDIAIMSSKGQSSVAARHLADELCSRHQIPLLVLHDFDAYGFSILGTLSHDNERYEFSHKIRVIDFGLHLEDVKKYRLPTEDVYSRRIKRSTLRKNGATEEEITFLLGNQRVELNAFTSDQLVEWIEAKLEEHGITKITPEDDYLAQAFRQAAAAEYLRDHAKEIGVKARRHAAEVSIPSNLRDTVKKKLEADPIMGWEKAIREIYRVRNTKSANNG